MHSSNIQILVKSCIGLLNFLSKSDDHILVVYDDRIGLFSRWRTRHLGFVFLFGRHYSDTI